MHFALLFALGLIFSVDTSGATANVICDSKHGSTNNSTDISQNDIGSLKHIAENCAAKICASEANENTITRRCGPVVLSITHSRPRTSDAGSCVGQFQRIIDQCITDHSVAGGISQTPEVLYDIDDSVQGSDGQALEDYMIDQETTMLYPPKTMFPGQMEMELKMPMPRTMTLSMEKIRQA
jgi:hypothetical protein